jgi:hypothetical protein
LGDLYKTKGNLAEAEEMYQRALQRYEKDASVFASILPARQLRLKALDSKNSDVIILFAIDGP